MIYHLLTGFNDSKCVCHAAGCSCLLNGTGEIEETNVDFDRPAGQGKREGRFMVDFETRY